MKTNVGNTYRTNDDVRKRDTKDVVWLIVWTVLLVSWSTFMLIVSFKTGFWSMPLKDVLMLFFISNIPTLIFGAGFVFLLKNDQHIKTTEFLIHKYERWNWKFSRYDTYYLTEQVTLNAKYIFHKHVGDYINKMSQEELEDYCKGLPGQYCTFMGYETQEEAMIDILNTIKHFIANDKAAENIKIKNVTTLETFTVSELKEKLANGEFDNLYKTKED